MVKKKKRNQTIIMETNSYQTRRWKMNFICTQFGDGSRTVAQLPPGRSDWQWRWAYVDFEWRQLKLENNCGTRELIEVQNHETAEKVRKTDHSFWTTSGCRSSWWGWRHFCVWSCGLTVFHHWIEMSGTSSSWAEDQIGGHFIQNPRRFKKQRSVVTQKDDFQCQHQVSNGGFKFFDRTASVCFLEQSFFHRFPLGGVVQLDDQFWQGDDEKRTSISRFFDIWIQKNSFYGFVPA